ncbi:MAG TPA: HAMP domain-containing sensor histidine kinase [Solirubrobacteraceae bacterium]|nr:HAMP domain-containing sensor histidine kinase [Solirubrobacteraceae bacterium]
MLARLVPRRLLRLPSRTVRLRLTLLYSGLFLVSGTVLLAITYIFVRSTTGPDLIVAGANPHGTTGPRALEKALANPAVARYVRYVAGQQYTRVVSLHTHDLHQLLVWSGIALAIVTLVSIALGWLVAGRVLRPLRTMTATTRQISERNLHERLALAGPDDELKDLGDTIDGLLARLQAHVAEQQRFAANASHELRTPLSITQTLLEVARNDPNRDTGELVDRLHAVNARAIDLTEALLLLSRADQRSFTRDSIDLSLVAEEAVETLLPLADQRGTTIEISGDVTPTIGSPPLLLQMAINLVHNAIVHNLLGHGTVWVTTSLQPSSAVLTVESTGAHLTPQLVARLDEPFQRGAERIRTDDHAGLGLGLAIVKSIAQAHEGSLTIIPRDAGGLHVSVRLPVAAGSAATPRQPRRAGFGR